MAHCRKGNREDRAGANLQAWREFVGRAKGHAMTQHALAAPILVSPWRPPKRPDEIAGVLAEPMAAAGSCLSLGAQKSAPQRPAVFPRFRSADPGIGWMALGVFTDGEGWKVYSQFGSADRLASHAVELLWRPHEDAGSSLPPRPGRNRPSAVRRGRDRRVAQARLDRPGSAPVVAAALVGRIALLLLGIVGLLLLLRIGLPCAGG